MENLNDYYCSLIEDNERTSMQVVFETDSAALVLLDGVEPKFLWDICLDGYGVSDGACEMAEPARLELFDAMNYSTLRKAVE